MSETDLEIASPSLLPDEQPAEAPEEKETKETPESDEKTEVAEDSEETTEETTEEEPEEQPAKPKRSREQRRRRQIARMAEERQKAQEEVAQLRQQLDALQSQPPLEEPKQEDFQSIDDFMVARAEFAGRQVVRQEMETLSKNVQQSQVQASQVQRTADWNMKAEAARDKYDDFDEVAQNPDLPVSPAMAMAIQEADNGTDVAYFLGENESLAQEISTLPDVQAVMRIGRISAQLANPPKPKQTTAPRPPAQVSGGGVTPQKDPSKMPYPEYVKMRQGKK